MNMTQARVLVAGVVGLVVVLLYLVFVGIALLLEIVLDLGVILWLNQYSEWLYIISRIFAARS